MIRAWIFSENKKFWTVAAGLFSSACALALLSFFLIDQKFAQYFGDPAQQKIWQFHRDITEIGAAEPYIVLGLIALFLPKFRKLAGFFLASVVTSGFVVHLLKFTLGRARPHRLPDNNPAVFEYFNFHHHFQSLPSGHAQTLFTVATFAAFLFPKYTWVFLISALYLAFSRAVTLAHFVSDVWMGAVIGIIMTAMTVKFLAKKYGS